MPAITPDEYEPTDHNRNLSLAPGLVLQNRYTLRECLGRGAMGEAWLASDSGRVVAGQPAKVVLKFLPEYLRTDPIANDRFREEYGRVWQLSHPGICRLFDMGEAPKVGCFQVMQHLEGVTLHKHLRSSGGPLPVSDVLSILRQAAEAIDGAHKQKVLHRDLKPDNIMYNPTTGEVHIFDFGLAAEIRNTTTMHSRGHQLACGTEPYMAPEQWRNRQLTARCDQWALGVVAWQLLTGQMPFQGSGMQLGFAIIQSPLPKLPRKLKRFRRVFSKVLSKNPRKRFSNCTDFVTALEKRQRRRSLLSHLFRLAVFIALIAGAVFCAALYERALILHRINSSRSNDVRDSIEDREQPTALQKSEPPAPAPAPDPLKQPAKQGSGQPQSADRSQETPILVIPSANYEDHVLQMRRLQEQTAKQLGKPLMVTNTIGIGLRLIPPGRFLMGSAASELGRAANESPLHEVLISKAIYAGQTEVTQRQWKLLMGTEPWKKMEFSAEGDDYPATSVSWLDAEEFLRRLSRKENRRYRLPTEAESQYLCRAGTNTRFYFGDDLARIDEYAWSDGLSSTNNQFHAQRVGMKKPNPFGLYDVLGNVCEYCSDWYDDSPHSHSFGTDPKGPPSGSIRVVRGGSWIYPSLLLRCASRSGVAPDYSSSDYGFRVILEL